MSKNIFSTMPGAQRAQALRFVRDASIARKARQTAIEQQNAAILEQQEPTTADTDPHYQHIFAAFAQWGLRTEKSTYEAFHYVPNVLCSSVGKDTIEGRSAPPGYEDTIEKQPSIRGGGDAWTFYERKTLEESAYSTAVTSECQCGFDFCHDFCSIAIGETPVPEPQGPVAAVPEQQCINPWWASPWLLKILQQENPREYVETMPVKNAKERRNKHLAMHMVVELLWGVVSWVKPTCGECCGWKVRRRRVRKDSVVA